MATNHAKNNVSTAGTRLCAICSQPGPHLCGMCMSVAYCSREHQKQHWKTHSEQCKLFVVKSNQKYGRYVVAARDIAPGTVIMNEPALTYGPKRDAHPLCLGCHKLLLTLPSLGNGEQPFTCPKCLFPMCGPECAKLPIHVENECLVFEKYNLPFPKIRNLAVHNPIYECILPVRCLLLKLNESKKWKRLQAMMHHNEARAAVGDVWYRNHVNIAKLLLDHCPSIARDFTEAEIHSVIGYIDVNAFEMIVNDNEVAGLFHNTYIMSHECVSNTHHTFTPDLRMVVRASVPIGGGEQITSIYTNILEGTADRLQLLKETKYFDCTCRRCADPTELGTYFSAVKCQSPKCASAPNCNYLMPVDPLCEGFASAWRWRCEGCLSEIPHATVQKVIEPIKDVLKKREKNFGHKDIVKKLELILKKYGGVLHPNHYLLMQVTHVLCDLYGKGGDGKKARQDEWRRKEELCRHSLQVLQVLAPGMSRLRGMALFTLQAAVYAQARIAKEFEFPNTNAPEPLGKETKARLYEVVQLLQESYAILRLDPPSTREGQIARSIPGKLKEVKALLAGDAAREGAEQIGKQRQ